MINTRNTYDLHDLEQEILTLEAELSRLNGPVHAPAPIALGSSNVIMGQFNQIARVDDALRGSRITPRRKALLCRLEYVRRRYYALREQMMHPAALAFAA